MQIKEFRVIDHQTLLDMGQEMKSIKYRKHKLPKSYKSDLARLEDTVIKMILSIERLGKLGLINLQLAEMHKRLTVISLAIMDLNEAKRFKLVRGNYFCKVMRFITDSDTDYDPKAATNKLASLQLQDEAVLFMRDMVFANYCKTDYEWHFCIEGKVLKKMTDLIESVYKSQFLGR